MSMAHLTVGGQWVMILADEMMLLSTGHKPTARDHTHPTFSADGTKIQIQSAMLSDDNRSMNIAVIYLPERLLKRQYKAVKRLD